MCGWLAWRDAPTIPARPESIMMSVVEIALFGLVSALAVATIAMAWRTFRAIAESSDKLGAKLDSSFAQLSDKLDSSFAQLSDKLDAITEGLGDKIDDVRMPGGR